MKALFSWLIRIDSPDEEVQRRGRNLVIQTAGMIALTLFFLVLDLIHANITPTTAIVGTAGLLFTGVLVLGRRGYVTQGGIILIVVELAGILGTALNGGRISVQVYYMVLPLLTASLCLRPWQIWPTLAVCLAGLALLVEIISARPLNQPLDYTTINYGTPMLCIVALMGFLGASSTKTALGAVQRARSEIEQAAQNLERANAELEVRVDARTADLQDALAEIQSRAAEQARLLAEVDQQRHTIHELSVPVIPVSATTLVMPLVGVLDSTRLLQLQEQALQALERTLARNLILDITGVALIDSQVGQGLLAVVQAGQLLGASVMLVGIRPEVAQAITGLGLNLQGIYTASDLQTALSRIAAKELAPHQAPFAYSQPR
jgi:rsbT co-antagonist protein RsbR